MRYSLVVRFLFYKTYVENFNEFFILNELTAQSIIRYLFIQKEKCAFTN